MECNPGIIRKISQAYIICINQFVDHKGRLNHQSMVTSASFLEQLWVGSTAHETIETTSCKTKPTTRKKVPSTYESLQ